jgi:hypothetical protein
VRGHQRNEQSEWDEWHDGGHGVLYRDADDRDFVVVSPAAEPSEAAGGANRVAGDEYRRLSGVAAMEAGKQETRVCLCGLGGVCADGRSDSGLRRRGGGGGGGGKTVTINASYPGDANYNSSTGSTNVVVQ